MASAVNLGLAAFAGLAVGAGATLVLRRDEHNKAGSEPRQPQQPGSPSTALPMPASSPSSAYQSGYGGTTTTTTTRPSSTAQPHAFPTEQTKVQTPGPPSSSSSSAAARTFDPRLTGVALARRVTDPVSIGPVSDHLRRLAYTTAYDRRLRIPAWTAEHLTKDSLKGSGTRAESVFKEDESIPPMFRAHLLDYFRSGYDRGHMVPAADAKISQEAMSETFLLSNIAPQVGEGFNRHYWAYLEQFCRTLTQQFEDVYVFTVPLFLPQKYPDGKWRVTYEMIAPQNAAPTIAVPTHFAKVVLTSRPSFPRRGGDEKEYSMGAFVLPNAVIPDEAPLTSFVVPVDAVESSAGLTLLPEQLKAIAKPLCQTTKCAVVVRRFDDANKKIAAGGGQQGRGRSQSL